MKLQTPSGLLRRVLASTAVFAASFACQAQADVIGFSFAGPGVSGKIVLTYGLASDAKYPQAFEVTGISGTFTDTNAGIVDATIGPLVAVNHATPEPGNMKAPADFSRFAVGTGLPPMSHGFLTYTNLFWPGGSPPTATDYDGAGGFLDIYGLLFNIGGGRVVNLWSNGVTPGGSVDYGVAVATPNTALDYIPGGLSAVPEPGSIALLGTALAGMLAWRRGMNAIAVG